MPTAAQRLSVLEARVKYLEEREKLTTLEMSFHRTGREAAESALDKQRDEMVKLRDDFAKSREVVAADVAVLKAEIAELKKHREHWSQRAWQVGAGVLLAVVGGVIGYLLKR